MNLTLLRPVTGPVCSLAGHPRPLRTAQVGPSRASQWGHPYQSGCRGGQTWEFPLVPSRAARPRSHNRKGQNQRRRAERHARSGWRATSVADSTVSDASGRRHPPPLPFLTEAPEARRGVWSCRGGPAARVLEELPRGGGRPLHRSMSHGRRAAPRRRRQQDETRRQRRGNVDRTAVQQRIRTFPLCTACADAATRRTRSWPRGRARARPTRRRPNGHGARAWHYGAVGGHHARNTAQQVHAERLRSRSGPSSCG